MATKKGAGKQMTVGEAGSKGGNATKARHGREFYEAIGRKGGKKGGATTKARHGDAHFVEIGRKGGRRVKELVEDGKKARRSGK